MKENALGNLFNSLFIIVIFGFFIYSTVSDFRKKNKIIKLKSGKIQSREIKGIVSEIKYNEGGRNRSSRINSRYFISKGINPITNEEMEFESDYFPYKDSWLKIRWMGPNQEDIKKLFEYARTFIKEGDTVKIHISNEDSNIYYIDDIFKNNEEISNNPIQTENIINIVGFKSSARLSNILKKVVIFGTAIVFLFVFVSRILDNAGSYSNMPKFDGLMNINLGGSYLIRIILVLLIIFIIYKVIADYKAKKD